MKKSFSYSLTAALAGLLFGFDTVVISGADQRLQELWNTSDLFHGWLIMASALWGTVLGALFGNHPTDQWGRKKTLLFIGLCFFISAIGSALANHTYVFIFFRFVGGIAIGVSTIAVPAYITEISKAELRGRRVALYQFSIVLGILVAMSSNYALQFIEDAAWRWMLAVEALPALFYCILVVKLDESPKWLGMKGRRKQAVEIADRIGLDWQEKKESLKELKPSLSFFRRNKRALFWVIALAFFNQFSGINAILYYAPRIFETAGLATSAAFLGSVGIGVVNLVFTLLGMYLIDRWGRKKLMHLGSIGYILSLTVIAIAFYAEWSGIIVVWSTMAFIAAHAVGQGTVIWVFIAEVFPVESRAQGQAVGSSVHWVLAAAIPAFIPVLFTSVGPAVVFSGFALMMVLQLLWVYFIMPETKGKKAAVKES
ncbi:MAG: sugar porter family MFS transporter [Vicingaceae bacterium]